MADSERPERLTKTIDLDDLGFPSLMAEARHSFDTVEFGPERRSYHGPTFQIKVSPRKIYTVSLGHVPRKWDEDWNPLRMSCTCCRGFCIHIAMALLQYEKLHGPIVLTEPDNLYAKRYESWEKEKYWNQLGSIPADMHSVTAAWPDVQGIMFYDIKAAAEDMQTNAYFVRRAEDVYQQNGLQNPEKRASLLCGALNTASSTFTVRCVLSDGPFSYHTDLRISQRKIMYHECSCSRKQTPDASSMLCEHELVLLRVCQEYEAQKPPTLLDDPYSQVLSHFFAPVHTIRRLDGEEAALPRRRLRITPRLAGTLDEPVLGFQVGWEGGHQYILKNPPAFLKAYEEQSTYTLSKKESIVFSLTDLTETSAKWMDFLQKWSETNRAFLSTVIKNLFITPTIASQFALTGILLDRLYDTALGTRLDLSNDFILVCHQTSISVQHVPLRITVKAEELHDIRDQLAGITLSGTLPMILSAAYHRYTLTQEGLSRLTAEEEKALQPFSSVAPHSGKFSVRFYRSSLPTYVYQVLPVLMDSPCIQFDNQVTADLLALVPPQPAFTFFCDLEDSTAMVRCQVRYGDTCFPLLQSSESGEGRDTEAEEQIRQCITSLMPHFDEHTYAFRSEPLSADGLYAFLQSGMRTLSELGEVRVTDAIRSIHVRKAPRFSVGVSIDSGVMDLSITSQDVPEEELLSILESYRRNKKYYRLRSGDFVDLQEESQLGDVDTLLSSLHLLPAEALARKVQLPAFRALYLDKLLEAHEDLVGSRDRHYRALVRNFRSIRDADFDVPEGLEQVLRPYQTYGYKWLRTLEFSGFGGILADEMGLGKTLQMIALFQSNMESGEKAPSLVVCPASLVYNWQEEIRRFAPALQVQVMAGTLAQRQQLFRDLLPQSAGGTDATSAEDNVPDPLPLSEPADIPAQKRRGRPRKHPLPETAPLSAPSAQTAAAAAASIPENAPHVLITSYDLLRRDIVFYQKILFHAVVLDEAQFIKNQNAGISKSVKVLHAAHRYALTGTPIENRLSELWSIFDFLMPGFLYTSKEFIQRFENPIARDQNEEVTAQLKKMVSPFILRRRKQDVLRDLPAKLEEVRYARLSSTQQKLYDAQVIHMRRTIAASDEHSGEDRIKILAELTRTRQICCDPSLVFENYTGGSAKREACLELIQSAIDGGHRMLVFSQFTSMLDLLEKDLTSAQIPFYTITGAIPKEKRMELVNAFNSGSVPVFLISLKAGGTGLNLTGADVVIHYDPWWNLAAQNQATDRAHRIGQTRQVTVYKLIAKDSIEEKILALQEAKQDLAEAILEGRGESLMSLSKEELLALLE